MGWKTTHQPNFDDLTGKGANNSYRGYTDLFCEFLASALFILIGTNAAGKDGALTGLSWGIAFVVVNIVFSCAHVNSWITFYKIFVGQKNLIEGLLTFGMQFLGAFVAGAIAQNGSFDLTPDNPTEFGIKAWQIGLKEAIALSLFLWCFLHQEDGGDLKGMPKSIFLVLAVAVSWFFYPSTIFTFSRCFQNADEIKKMGPYVLWGFVAVVCTHVKRKVLDIEKNWFFQESPGELVESADDAEETTPINEDA